MKRKRYTEAQIAFALRQAESGTSAAATMKENRTSSISRIIVNELMQL